MLFSIGILPFKDDQESFEICLIASYQGRLGGGWIKKERGPEPRPLLQATILFHLRGRL